MIPRRDIGRGSPTGDAVDLDVRIGDPGADADTRFDLQDATRAWSTVLAMRGV